MCQVLLFWHSIPNTLWLYSHLRSLLKDVVQSAGSAEQIVLPRNSLLARTGEYLTYEMILGEKKLCQNGNKLRQSDGFFLVIWIRKY